MVESETLDAHNSHDGLRSCLIRAAELSDGVDEALVELDGPAETRLRVGGEDETGISLDAHWPIMMRSHRGRFFGSMEHFYQSFC